MGLCVTRLATCSVVHYLMCVMLVMYITEMGTFFCLCVVDGRLERRCLTGDWAGLCAGGYRGTALS